MQFVVALMHSVSPLMGVKTLKSKCRVLPFVCVVVGVVVLFVVVRSSSGSFRTKPEDSQTNPLRFLCPKGQNSRDLFLRVFPQWSNTACFATCFLEFSIDLSIAQSGPSIVIC